MVINADRQVIASVDYPFPDYPITNDTIEHSSLVWQAGVIELLERLSTKKLLSRVRAIAVDGTSGTVLGLDSKGDVVTPGLMYNDQRAVEEGLLIAFHCPDDEIYGNTSALARILWLNRHYHEINHFQSQAGWISGWLGGDYRYGDSNNLLKMGLNAAQNRWPEWFSQLPISIEQLPTPLSAGTVQGTLEHRWCERWSLSEETQIIAGTTDSTAAVLASGACQPGDGITSLGSTMVMKQISATPIELPEYGIYSQPFGHWWLVGGASNSGGSVLRQHFNVDEIETLSLLIDPDSPLGLDYYPLPAKGERFPVCAEGMESRLEPRPDKPHYFLQAIFEGMGQIEAKSYALLEKYGAPQLTRLYTLGGGSRNLAWKQIRERQYNLPIHAPVSRNAAFGTALLAQRGYLKSA